MSSFFSADIGVSQGLAFFIVPIFHIFEKRIKNLNILISFLSFVDDDLFISQEKSFVNTNANSFCSYNIMTSLLDQFGLKVKYRKTKIFYFSRLYSIFNPPALSLSQLGWTYSLF